MSQWQAQADEYLSQKDYAKAISIYEQAIHNKPEVITNYFYLGLIQLLQGQEIEAQFTWMAGIAEQVAIEQMDVWTELVEILSTEAQRQIANSDYETAWLICQHIHEINQSNLDNSLTVIWLSIQLQTLDAETLIFVEVIEYLTEINISEIPTQLNHDLLWEVLASLLKYDPYPLLIEFTEACLPFVKEANRFIYNLIKSSIELAYNQHREYLAISLLELCLRLSPKHLEVLEHICRIQLKIGCINEGLEMARLYSQLAERLVDKLFANTLLLRTLLQKGGNWQETVSIFTTQESLSSSLIKQSPTELSQAIASRLYITNYFTPYIRDEAKLNRTQQNQISQLCQAMIKVDLAGQMQRFRDRPDSQKLKIGYISRCMTTHSVGFLARWLMLYHDHNQFEIYGYFLSYRQYPDELQSWYESQMDHVYRVGIDGSENCTEIANRIYQDQIDILIDLDSSTFDITCVIMALKPAPIQVTWLGCDASGIPTIDYFIADPFVLPDCAQEYYAEKIWRLPQTYIAVDGFEVGVPTLRRDQLDIPADAVVYLSAQSAFKRHPDTVRLQMQIIKSVPNSYFLIKGMGDQDSIKDFFRQIAIAEGVEIEKLRFLPLTVTEDVHRANLAIADVVLDTYPYNGATTTLEALWMCLPLVTRVGEQFAARNSYTMMMNTGISEGIAWTDEEYVEWGVKFGKDPALRENITIRLKASRQTSPLWNGKKFTRDMENAYQQMWNIYVDERSQT